ncbi:MAG: hypothetical protein V2J20_13355 [Wenzhouxiangella sp.]|jgi:hypothetical protein|nr:hypothetical protein [Wenzhouxiangella sp.]
MRRDQVFIWTTLFSALAALSPVVSAIVVSNDTQLIQAVENRESVIEVAGNIEFFAPYGLTHSALPRISDFEVTLKGLPGAAIVAAAPGFRLAEVAGPGRLNIVSLTIAGFSADDGGAIAVEGGQLSVRDSSFIDNQSILSGGAIQVRLSGAALELRDSVFQGNEAGRRGGAVSLHGLDVPVIVERNQFVGNQATFGCALSIVDTEQGRFSDNVFRGDCASALVDLDTSRIGPDLFNNTWLASGSMAFRFRPHGDLNSGRARMAGNVLVQNAIGPALCQGTAPGDGIESLGENVATDASCELDAASDWIEPDPWRILLDPLAPELAQDGPATEVRILPVTGIDGSAWRCGIADATGLGRPQDANGDGWPDCDLGAVELARGPALSGAHSGAFYDPSRNGEGYFIEILDGGLAWISFFSYAPLDETFAPIAMAPSWYTGVGWVKGNSIVVTELTQTQGGIFGPEFDPGLIAHQQVGGLSLVFSDCESGADNPGWSYLRSDQLGTDIVQQHSDLFTPLVRLSRLMACDPAGMAQGDGRSGSFFDPARSGEGITVQWMPDGRVLVVWYTYDSEGKQFWAISDSAEVIDGVVVADMFYPAQSTAFGPDFDASEIELAPWGSLVLDYHDCGHLEMSYDSLLPAFGSGAFDYVRLTQPAGTVCDLSAAGEVTHSTE